MKAAVLILIIVVGSFMLKMSTDTEEATRQNLIKTTNDPTELITAIVHDDKARPTVTLNGPQRQFSEMTISYTATYSKNESQVWTYNYNLEKIAKQAFPRFPSLNKISVMVMAPLVDLRGNRTVEPVLRSTFSRSNAATIQWENVRVENIPKIADQYWVHPAMLRND
jgi:hypothetical protein